MTRMARRLVIAAGSLAALTLAACDAKDQNAVNRAATGTKNAVNNTVDSVNNAQDAAIKAAEEVNEKK